MADNTAGKQRGRPFDKGTSGNPAGRPVGARNRATVAAEALLDGEAEALTRKILELAHKGDITALRLCLDRVVPIRRERLLNFELPPLDSTESAATESAATAMSAITAAVAAGEITLGEAAEVGKLVEMLSGRARPPAGRRGTPSESTTPRKIGR
jgi:hypothetical protein